MIRLIALFLCLMTFAHAQQGFLPASYNYAGIGSSSGSSAATSPGAPDTSVQYNNMGTFAGSSLFTFSNSLVTTPSLTVTGVLTTQSMTYLGAVATSPFQNAVGNVTTGTYINAGSGGIALGIQASGTTAGTIAFGNFTQVASPNARSLANLNACGGLNTTTMWCNTFLNLQTGGTWTGSSAPTMIRGFTTPTGSLTGLERFRVDQSGAFLISTTTGQGTGVMLGVNGIISSTGSSVAGAVSFTALPTGTALSNACLAAGGGLISTTGLSGCLGVSDPRAKKDIRLLAYGLWDLLHIDAIMYKDLREGAYPNEQVGLLAYDTIRYGITYRGLEAVMPELVSTGGPWHGGMLKSVVYERMTAVLVRATQQMFLLWLLAILWLATLTYFVLRKR